MEKEKEKGKAASKFKSKRHCEEMSKSKHLKFNLILNPAHRHRGNVKTK